jgi:Bacteriophage probable baseplate hub protein
MTEPLLTQTAPALTVDGQLRAELTHDLVRLEVEETTEGLKTLSARFLAFGPRPGAPDGILHLDGRVFDFGKSFDVALGSEQDPRTVFRGKISALEADFEEGGVPEVVVFAEDRFMDLRTTRRMRTYERMSDKEIAEEIASKHGLSAEVDADGPTYDLVQQWNVSDLAFLRERARRIRAEVWLQDDTLFFKSRDKRGATELTLVQGNHLLRLQARADLAHQRTAVRVSGYDAKDRAAIDEEAGGDAIQAEIAGGRTGPDVLQRAFGERVSFRVREVPLTSSEAADWARADMLRRCRSFVQVIATTRGTADLVVGSRLTLQRVGAPFEGGGYHATRVRHTYDLEQGFRTHFEAERPTIEEGS